MSILSQSFARLRSIWPYLLFLTLILFSLRDVLALPGVIGHSWDWDVSAFPEQIWGRLSHDFFVWDYELRGGYYAPFRTGGLFSLFALPFSMFGGEVFSRLYIIIPMFLAAFSMRRLAMQVLGLNATWSTVAAILYMLSPVVYSRIITGHNFLLDYALLPLLYVYVHQAMSGSASGQLALRESIAAGLVLGIEAIHSSMMALAFVVVGLIILVELVRSNHKIQVVTSSIIVFAVFALLNTYWALPVGIGYASTGTLFHSGSALQAPEQVTASTVVSQRENLLLETGQRLIDALRMNAVPGYGPEFTYPVPGVLATPWLIVSLLIPIAAFAALLVRRARHDVVWVLAITGVFGTLLVSGGNTPISAFVYQYLMTHVFPVWAEFGNAVRAMPLVAFALCALAPFSLQRLTDRSRTPGVIIGFSLLLVLIYVSPFLTGSTMADRNTELALRAFQPSLDDRQVYDFLKNEKGDYRVSYVQPPWVYYPELYDLGYEWLGGLSPHPEFFVPYINPPAWQAASRFSDLMSDVTAGRLLGLASVKYLVYPRERYIDPDVGMFPKAGSSEGKAHLARLVDQVLERQTNLAPVTTPFSSTKLLLNKAYLPRIYAATEAILVEGNTDSIASVVNSPFFSGQPALFFQEQQPTPALRTLEGQTDRTLAIVGQDGDAVAVNGTGPAFLASYSPFQEPAGSFVIPRATTYAVQIQSSRFQFVPPHTGDLTSITFVPTTPDPDVTISGNLLHSETVDSESRALIVNAFLPGQFSRDQFLLMGQSIEPLNLADYPNLEITSQVENPAVQGIAVELELDVEGDESGDVTWTSPLFNHGKFRRDTVDALQLVRREFPGKERYRVVRAGLRLQRNPEGEWDRGGGAARLYEYAVQELGLYSRSQPGWVWHPPSNLGKQEVQTLSRSLSGLDPSRYPLTVEYRSDGPARLYIETRLVFQTVGKEDQIIPVSTRLIEPFSAGQLTIDVRDRLSGADDSAWRNGRVEFIARRLAGTRELRPTSLRLERVGATPPSGTDASPAKPSVPTLTLDGKVVSVSQVTTDDGDLSYVSSGLTLGEGRHTFSVSFDRKDVGNAVESISIIPGQRNSKPVDPPTINFESVNPTRFRAHVVDGLSPFFLVFSETFHEGWRAYTSSPTGAADGPLTAQRWYEQSSVLSWLFDSGRTTEIPDHYLVNGFANGWFVDKRGTYDIVIEFSPQRMYEGGWMVTLLTLAICIVALLALRKSRSN